MLVNYIRVKFVVRITRYVATDTTLPPADEDNESVGSSQEDSVVSEEGAEKQDTEEQLAFQFGEAVEQLLEKR